MMDSTFKVRQFKPLDNRPSWNGSVNGMAGFWWWNEEYPQMKGMLGAWCWQDADTIPAPEPEVIEVEKKIYVDRVIIKENLSWGDIATLGFAFISVGFTLTLIAIKL